jgi:hypothetical protein
MCIAYGNYAIERGVLYICLPRKPHGPTLLEEAYRRLHSVPCLLTLEVLGGRQALGIWATRFTGKDALHSIPCLLTLEVLGGRRASGIWATRLTGNEPAHLGSVRGSTGLGHMGNTTHG